SWSGLNVDMGNPHAVVFVDDLADAGKLFEPPVHDEATYPDGVNVEFLKRTGAGRVAMRVHERGSGETRSCGTGACAAMVATQLQDESPRGTPYEVDVLGGRLFFEWTDEDRVLMTGPAELVAEGFVTVP
ncbi:MAG: diaminopimelate epimerase, partial [Myxococcales bacterium]